MDKLEGEASSSQQLDKRLKITEIFHSIQGEAIHVGWPSVFIRLTGCPLRCQYCDTAYAFGGGEWHSIDEIIAKVRTFDTQHVCVTGGEPLAQTRCHDLLVRLCDEGFIVSLETSGAIDIGDVDPRVCRVVDIKTPGSNEVSRNRLENLRVMNAGDAIKFVICGREDYDWAKKLLATHHDIASTILFSPSHEELSAAELADWMLADRLSARLQVQLHKVLWGNVAGR